MGTLWPWYRCYRAATVRGASCLLFVFGMLTKPSYARIRKMGVRGLDIDDYLMIMAGVGSSHYTCVTLQQLTVKSAVLVH